MEFLGKIEGINKEKLVSLLNQIDNELEGLQRKLKLYCVGGTKLTLLNMKYVSKDIDFIVSRRDWKVLSGIVGMIEYKEKIRFDFFPEGQLPNYDYPSYPINSKKLKYNFKHMEIYSLDDTDFILTKALAGRDMDYKDISLFLKNKTKPSKEELIKRFERIKPLKGKEEELKEKFNIFIKEFYRN